MSVVAKEYKVAFIRISGVNIPSKKKVFVGLPMVFGIGYYRAFEICAKVNVDPQARMGDLTDDQLNSVRKYIEDNYKVEGDLRSQISADIKTLVAIGCYRGMRHRKGLPVRGQRTKTNAKTRKKRKA